MTIASHNGFLSCSVCDSLIYTKLRRADYYVCKSGKRLLKTVTPEVRVADYRIEGLFIGGKIVTEGNRMAMAYDENERIFLPLGLSLKAA